MQCIMLFATVLSKFLPLYATSHEFTPYINTFHNDPPKSPPKRTMHIKKYPFNSSVCRPCRWSCPRPPWICRRPYFDSNSPRLGNSRDTARLTGSSRGPTIFAEAIQHAMSASLLSLGVGTFYHKSKNEPKFWFFR
jgi:hypothetical protein